MALVINDRVKETSTTTGTGNITLAGVPTGEGTITFNTGIGTPNTTYYAIHNQGTDEWEVGYGVLNAGATQIVSRNILSSSNSDSAVNFTSGTKDVFCTLPAGKAVYLDSTGTPVGAASAGFALAMAVAL